MIQDFSGFLPDTFDYTQFLALVRMYGMGENTARAVLKDSVWRVGMDVTQLKTDGRPIELYKIPSPQTIAARFGVQYHNIKINLQASDLQSNKALRMAYISHTIRSYQRRTQTALVMSRSRIARMVGLSSKRSITTYMQQMRDIEIEKRIRYYTVTYRNLWRMFNAIEDDDKRFYLVDLDTNKRYPAKRWIAIKLLSENRAIALCEQLANAYIVHDMDVDMDMIRETALPSIVSGTLRIKHTA